MLIDAIRPGDKLNIQQLDVKFEAMYQSKLLDTKEDDVISISMPIEKNKVIIMDIGSKYRVTFYTAKGLFAYDTVVIQRYKSMNIYVAELHILSEAKKVQRREFYRFHCNVNIEYCVIPRDQLHVIMKQISWDKTTHGWTEMQKKNRAVELLMALDTINGTQLIEMKHGSIIDISGGGMKFKTDTEIDQKKEIYLSFSLRENIHNIYICGEIIASEKSQVHNNSYENRLRFTGISKEDREEIIHYVLREELKLRQKEKGFS